MKQKNHISKIVCGCVTVRQLEGGTLIQSCSVGHSKQYFSSQPYTITSAVPLFHIHGGISKLYFDAELGHGLSRLSHQASAGLFLLSPYL